MPAVRPNTADLATVGPWDFGGKLGNTMTAHPKVDPGTGRMHFFGYEIFDAQSMARGPVAEVQLPVRVPFGFHGLWVDEAQL